jgi:threonine synthase
VLEAVFDLEAAGRSIDPARPDWSHLCAVEPEHHPPFAVGGTPLVGARRLGRELGLRKLLVKNDGLNPTGSLKDRASFLVVAEAIRLGERQVVTASTGNAAVATAAVCAAAGLEAVIYVPESAPRAKLAAMLLHGARVVRVRGSYDDAFRMSIVHTRRGGGLNRNTAYHPLTIEGKKTVALEIWQQAGVPDAVVVPVGDGVVISGVWKGFRDLVGAGLADRVPRLVAVQAESSDAIHNLIETGAYRSARPATAADSISVADPSNAWMAARAVRETGGTCVTVTDDEIFGAQSLLARTEGIFAEPAAAAAVAGLRKAGLEPDGTNVVLVTGHGLKDVDAALGRLELPEPVEPGETC